MKLTKQLETEVLEVYDTWLNSYLTGDINTYDSYLDDDYRFIGSTGNEEFLSRKDTTKFFEATADQLAGKTDIRNSSRTVQQIGELIFITQLLDGWFLNEEEWFYYGRFRFTSVLRKRENGWKFIYQHFSTPDSKAGQGDTIGYEKISAENLQLREAIKRRTTELERKNRELEVEAALERVRAAAMSMHTPDELKRVGEIIFAELKSLGFADLRNTEILINNDKKESVLSYYYSDYGVSGAIEVFYNDHPVVKNWAQEMQKASDAFAEVIIAENEMAAWKKYREEIGYAPDPKLEAAKSLNYYSYSTGLGALSVSSFTPITEEQMQILGRFRNVFGLAYRRYVDVAQAEAQAREAQIEAALEKVRSRTMAMHKADELSEVVTLVVGKLMALGVILDANGVILCTYFPNSRDVLHWIASPDFSFTGSYLLPYFDHPIFKQAWESKLSGAAYWSKAFSVEEKNSFFEYAFEHSDYKHFPDEFKEWVFQNDKHSLSFAWSENSAILIPSHTGVVPSEDDIEILKRFAKVFEQAYVRFMDLQKAEAQTREAQIELSLERIRAQVTAMRESSELLDIVVTMRTEFVSLGHEAHYFWHMRWLPDRYEKAMTSGDGSRIGMVMTLPRHIHGDIEPVADWEKSDEPTHVLAMDTDMAVDYVDKMITLGDFEQVDPQAPTLDDVRHIGGLTFIMARTTHGEIGYSLPGVVPDPPKDAVDILMRFAGVFDLAYRRFLDLQQAEARAREAVRQASLDRVRAEIASMRRPEDLQRITPLIWRELTALGVPFFRCGVFIIDEATELTHAFLSTPSGQAVAALHMKFDSAPFIHAAVQHWRQQQVYREKWNREQFVAWTQALIEQGMIESPEEYQAGGDAPENLVLHFMPFTQGMLYIGSSSALSDHEIELSRTLAKAFGMAYARYEDFQKLEAAKAEVEAALENLKKTQGQLIQAEKMASLGQLTAGIAHEIKNPLNFVINFARLSSGLMDELSEELGANSDKTVAEVRELLDELLVDLRANNEKINEHGKRADSIVKSMMQHARGGKGSRQPTDVNALVDEYLNLTYHGMRARVPDFDTSIERDFGEIDGKVDMVPQEIGRVLLNIMGNACDAVYQRAQTDGNAFQPRLSVATRQAGAGVEIRISDNGTGISDEIREKIFEPFFTTKPAGSGTGLGLSLSYDIVTQGHGGTLTVESAAGDGASFVVTLPAAAR